jgi:hypothetical protein
MSLVDRLNAWMLDDAFFESCRNWVRDNVHKIDLSTPDFLLSYSELHREFEEWVESKLEKFILDNDTSIDELHTALRLVRERRRLRLSCRLVTRDPCDVPVSYLCERPNATE